MGRELPDLWSRTAASVQRAAGSLVDGWTLQWCIHADGVDPEVVQRQAWWDAMRPMISLSSSDRSGFAGARNKALANATGEVLGMCDDDDELAPGWAELLPVLLREHCAWVVGATEDIDRDGRVLRSPPLSPGPVPPGGAADAFLATRIWPWHGCAAVVRTELVRAVGGWDLLPWCEDLSMWAAITERAAGVQLATVTYRLRQHPDRATFSPLRLENIERGLAAVEHRIATLRAAAETA